MSVRAYVLIEGAAGQVHKILEKIKTISDVKSADAVTGQYDIIALVEASDLNTLAKVSYSKIQMIEGVLRTITCNIIEL